MKSCESRRNCQGNECLFKRKKLKIETQRYFGVDDEPANILNKKSVTRESEEYIEWRF
jgi:hypothetical protein